VSAASAHEVARALAERTEELCRDLLSAGRRNGRYWTVGGVENARGKSLYVHLSGPKRGRWQDAATGEFGDMLDLVAACRYGGNKREAYQWAVSYLGLGGAAPAERPRPAPAVLPGPDRAEQATRAAALALWLRAEPKIAGTPVDFYLKARGLDLGLLGRQPRAIRYHPRLYCADVGRHYPAMVTAIAGPDGGHLATHRTWLEERGGAWRKAAVPAPKKCLGVFAGGSIRLWRGASGKPLKDADPAERVLIAEGIETGLSIALAVPELRVLAAVSLGNLGSLWLPDHVKRITLCIDADDKPAAQAGLMRAADRHLAAGRDVRFARPRFGGDFNDAFSAAA
jgi:hypothetical protein